MNLAGDFFHDVRHAVRHLRDTPLFALTATASLAIGIGASAAVFTVIERALLRPLPISNPHELVYVTDDRILTQPNPRFSYPFYAVMNDTTVLDGVAARAGWAVNAGVDGQRLRANGELVSGSYFRVVGVRMQAGRPLSADDDRAPGAHPVAVISEGFRRRVFTSEPSVIGREMHLNERTFTIVGVTAKGFFGTDIGSPTDIWIPMMMQRDVGRDLLTEARTNWLEIIGRSRPGVTFERAGEELTRHLERRSAELPSGTSRRIVVVSGGKGHSAIRSELGPALAILMMLAALALALSCVNIASLVAVRAASREKEIAIRLALGARRGRLARQFLTEGLILSGLGGAAGLLIAPVAARLLVASQPHALGVDLDLDMRVLMFALVASALAGLVVAQVPLLAARRIALAACAGASALAVTGRRRVNAHDVIVVLQIAMALAMLISAALFVQSLRGFSSVNPGFRADNLLLAALDPRAAGYEADNIELFWRGTLARVNQIQGVAIASLARTIPLAAGRQRQPWLNPGSGEKLELDTNFVGPRYFQTLEIPLLAGREFDEHDGKTSRPVVIVNERLARMFWPQQDAIGKGLRVPEQGNPIAEVVGVVGDVKYRDLRGEAGPMVYRPVFQTRSTDALSLHVRTAGSPVAVMDSIGIAVQDVDRNVPLLQVTTLEEQLDGSFAQTRQAAALTGAFGVIALVMSGLGVYGVTALTLRRQTRDLGIRMALGARGHDIVRAIGLRGAAIVLVGVTLGLASAFGFTRFTEALIFGVSAEDPATFAGMAALLALVALIGFAVPVRSATRLNAVAAIRHE